MGGQLCWLGAPDLVPASMIIRVSRSHRFHYIKIYTMEIWPKFEGIPFLLSRVLSRGCDVITLFHLRDNS